MKTAKAIELAGMELSGDQQKHGHKALADLLGITQSAISQWKDDVPKPREWQLRVLRPHWFAEEPQEGQSAEAAASKVA